MFTPDHSLKADEFLCRDLGKAANRADIRRPAIDWTGNRPCATARAKGVSIARQAHETQGRGIDGVRPSALAGEPWMTGRSQCHIG